MNSKFKNNSENSIPTFRMAKIPAMFDSIKVIDNSEEDIFEDIFVTAILPNNRVVKLKKSSLVFSA